MRNNSVPESPFQQEVIQTYAGHMISSMGVTGTARVAFNPVFDGLYKNQFNLMSKFRTNNYKQFFFNKFLQGSATSLTTLAFTKPDLFMSKLGDF